MRCSFCFNWPDEEGNQLVIATLTNVQEKRSRLYWFVVVCGNATIWAENLLSRTSITNSCGTLKISPKELICDLKPPTLSVSGPLQNISRTRDLAWEKWQYMTLKRDSKEPTPLKTNTSRWLIGQKISTCGENLTSMKSRKLRWYSRFSMWHVGQLILSYPITQELRGGDKDILWQFRFFLINNRKVLLILAGYSNSC